jgi:predicted nucleic acid-binding protein
MKSIQIVSHGKLTKEDFKQKIGKVGLDANILIDMILSPDFSVSVIILKLVRDKFLCTSKRAYLEAVGILKHEYNHNNASKEVRDLTRKLNIESFIERREDFGAAFGLLEDHKLDIKTHFKDMLILANLKRNNVSHIISKDKLFIKTAEEEGFKVINIPKIKRN